MIKYFKYIAKYLSFFFAGIFLIDFIQIHIQLFERKLDFHLSGFNNYFQMWQNNASALALSFTVISLYYIFEQIEISSSQKYLGLYESWRKKQNLEINKLSKYSIIYHVIDDNLYNVYLNLISTNQDFRIKDKKHLKSVIKPFLSTEKIKECEKFMNEYTKKSPSDVNTSYSLITDFIKSVFLPSFGYLTFSRDLEEIYNKKKNE